MSRRPSAEGEKKWAAEEVALTPIDTAGLKALTANDSGKLRLVNVWATWCGPCQVEFPDLVAVYRMYRGRGLELATLSADPPEKSAPVLAFLKEQRASGRNHIFEKPDPYALIDPIDPKWQGELPHTVVVAPGGRVVYRSEGAFDPLALRKAIVGYYGRYYHSVAGQ